MENFLLENSSIVEENLSIINWLKEQSEAEIEKRKCSLSHCFEVGTRRISLGTIRVFPGPIHTRVDSNSIIAVSRSS